MSKMLTEEQEVEFIERVLDKGARTAMAVQIGDRRPGQYDKADEIAAGIARGVRYALRAAGLRPADNGESLIARAEGEIMVTVHLRPDPEGEAGEWYAASTGTTHNFVSASDTSYNDNPYEAAWNALARTMQKLGFGS